MSTVVTRRNPSGCHLVVPAEPTPWRSSFALKEYPGLCSCAPFGGIWRTGPQYRRWRSCNAYKTQLVNKPTA